MTRWLSGVLSGRAAVSATVQPDGPTTAKVGAQSSRVSLATRAMAYSVPVVAGKSMVKKGATYECAAILEMTEIM